MNIERNIFSDLLAWKDAPIHKPVLLQGARQIGKSWVMETLGKRYFDHYVKIDFDRQPEAKSAFAVSKEPIRILKELAFFADSPIVPGKTLLILDEIQECEEALNALKYFTEDMPQLHIIAAGSLLGVAVRSRHMTVPVGKVQWMRMYPVTFLEYLKAADDSLYAIIEDWKEVKHLPNIVLDKLKTEYKRYMVCGGMPEAAAAMLENYSIAQIDTILQSIINLYELDFAKYAEPRDIPRIQAVWHSLPSQLAKENRKFIYKVIRTGARSKDYEDALLWLEESGMIYRIPAITTPRLPLSAYEDTSAFKVYCCDIGILRRLARLPADALLHSVAGYTEFKGALAENAVLQSILPILGDKPFYWTSENQAEIEFVIQWGTEIIPVEVKAGECISGRSLTVYNNLFHPLYRLRTSMLNLQNNEGLVSLPLPMVECFPRYVNEQAEAVSVSDSVSDSVSESDSEAAYGLLGKGNG